MGYAVLFPGQGSQFTGMGEDVFAARPDLLGASADEVLGWSLSDACLHGSENRLKRTEIAQPALYALGYALWEALRDAMPEPPVAAAGHSLGEYTALAASGAIDYLAGLRLVAARGRAMARAATAEPSGMAALLGTAPEVAEEAVASRRAEGGRIWVANLNSPTEIVAAGGLEDIHWIEDNAARLGIRRVVPLKVAGAFHSPFMEPAAAELAAALAEVDFSTPTFPVWANATAAPVDGDIAGLLTRQLTSPVRFIDTLRGMAAAGAASFVHVGPGVVTATMAKRTIRGATTHSVNHLDAVAPTVAALGHSIQ